MSLVTYFCECFFFVVLVGLFYIFFFLRQLILRRKSSSYMQNSTKVNLVQNTKDNLSLTYVFEILYGEKISRNFIHYTF